MPYKNDSGETQRRTGLGIVVRAKDTGLHRQETAGKGEIQSASSVRGTTGEMGASSLTHWRKKGRFSTRRGCATSVVDQGIEENSVEAEDALSAKENITPASVTGFKGDHSMNRRQ